MAALRIDSGPIGVTNDSRNTPREQWPELVEFRRDYIIRDFGFDCRNIVEWLNDSDHMWQALGYQSLDEMVRKGLRIDPADASLVAEWLKRYRPDYPVGLPQAINYALRDGAGTPKGNVNNPLGLGGKSHKAIDNSDNYQNYQSDEDKPNRTLGKVAGTSADYTRARLQRDNPALHERVMRGELSPNAAAIEAGWRRATIRYSLPSDPQAAGRYLAQRVDKEWLLAMVDEAMKSL